MMWDKYKKFLDRRGMKYGFKPDLEDAIKDAEKAAHFADGSRDIEDLESHTLDFADDFFLPFPIVAVEFFVRKHGNVVVQLWSPEIDEGRDVRLKDFTPVNVVLGSRDGHVVQIMKGYFNVAPNGEAQVALYSVCAYEMGSGKCLSSKTTDTSLVVSGMSTMMSKQETENYSEGLLTFVSPAVKLIEQANSPANWIVEVKDEHARVVKRRGKQRKDPRTRYIVVPDRDLNRVVRLPNEAGDHVERAPHRRRAHWRRLTSERYRLKRGQRILVKESWIGPRESVHGGERYTVLTSLPGRAS